jgi:hypothetical protein
MIDLRFLQKGFDVLVKPMPPIARRFSYLLNKNVIHDLTCET